jgi:lipoprotein-releasing system permease protein
MKGKNTAGTVLYGVDFSEHATVSPIFQKFPEDLSKNTEKINRGIFTGYRNPDDYKADTILLGYDLAMNLRAIPGDKIKVMAPIGTIPTPFGLMPKTRELTVGGIFISGMPEYDRLFSFSSLENCNWFLEITEGSQYLEIRSDNPRSTRKLIKQLEPSFPELTFEDWSSFDRNMYQAMRLEKVVMMVILSLMILITSFNLTGNFAKMIVRQRKEIGILKSLGCSDTDIFRIYLRQGLTIGISGTVIGVLLASLFIFTQNRWHFIKIPAGNLPLSALPVDPRLWDFVIITGICLTISFLATLFPAMQARRIDPLKIIRQ